MISKIGMHRTDKDSLSCVTDSFSSGNRDRIRTSVNVLGDAYGAGIVHHLCKDDLEKADLEVVKEQAEEEKSPMVYL